MYEPVAMAVGTALFFPTALLSALGELDETLFAYWEDVDLSFRALQSGLELRVVDDAVVSHAMSASSGGVGSQLTEYLVSRNELHILRKFLGPASQPRGILKSVARRLVVIGLLRERGRPELADAMASGTWAGLLGMKGGPDGLIGRRTAVPAFACQHPWFFNRVLDSCASVLPGSNRPPRALRLR